MKTIIKSAFIFFSLTLGVLQTQATTLLNETFGTPSSNPVITSYTGWSSSATFSGTGSVRTSAASSTSYYSTATGSGNVFLNSGQTFIMSGVNTSNYTDLSISLGFYQYKKAATADSVSFEVSANGSTWSPLTCTLPSDTWIYETLSGSIPSTSNLYLRVTNNSKQCQFRLDDITISGKGASIPIITTNANSESFTTLTGASKNDTLTVSGTDLTEDITLALSGNNADQFSISSTTASASSTSKIVVVYTPTTAGTHSATLTLTSSNDTVKIALSGKAYQSAASGVWVEDFETGSKSAYAESAVTCTKAIWNFSNALIGTPANNDKTFGSQAVRIRDAAGFVAMNEDKANGADSVIIYAGLYSTHTYAAKWVLEMSINQGSTWTKVGDTISTTSTSLAPVKFAVKQSGNVRFKITKTNASSSNTLNIDNVTITDFKNAGIAENTINASIYGAKGYAVVNLSGKATVKVLSTQGIIIEQKQLAAGQNILLLNAGIYLVQVGSKVEKIIVR